MPLCIFCGELALSGHECSNKVTNKIEQDFLEFHSEHPEVYSQLVRLARQWTAAGRAKLGIKTLFEKLRWEWHINGLEDSNGYKLNNNYTALYARLIMRQEDDLDGLFEVRSLASERQPMVWSTNA